MCAAAPPAGADNPNSRTANSPGAQSPYTPPTPETTASGTQIPLGANAGLAASRAREGAGFGTQSFQQQGFAGVGTRPAPPTGGETSSAAGGMYTSPLMDTGGSMLPPAVGGPRTTDPTSGIVAPRMMDTNPLLGSGMTPSPTPSDPSPTPTAAAPTMELFQPRPMDTNGALLSPASYALPSAGNLTPVSMPTASPVGNAVVNALMRRRANQGGYY